MDYFPVLHTPRLALRKIQVEDIDALILYANNRKISDQVINIPYPYQEPNAVFRISYVVQGFKNKTRYVFAIVLKERAELIGEISLHLDEDKNSAQLGYWVGEPFWNLGIGTEASRAILQFGFEKLQLRFIHATCHVDNKASERVLLKNGLSEHNENGKVKRYVITQGEYETWKTSNGS